MTEAMTAGATAISTTRRQMFGWAMGGIAFAATASPARAFWQSADRWPQLRAYINDYVTSRRLPGAIAAFALGDSPLQTVAAGTLAMDSRTPVDLDSLWRIYSMTKPVTGMAVMQLIERGLLTLDQPLYEILPKFRTMRVLTSVDAPVDQTVPADRVITIRHLLTHTAGIGYSIIQSGPIRDYYQAHGIVPGQVSRMSLPGLDRGRPAASLEAFADALADAPLVYQPGTTWSYSVSLDLLGRVIEVVSGLPFDSYLQQRIFDPLGMASTGFRVAEANIPRLSTNYAPLGGILLPIDPATTSIYLDRPAFPFGGAGLVSSARDYDRFLAMLMNEGTLGGERILAPEIARLAMSNLLPAGIDTRGTFVNGAGFGAGGRVSLASAPEGEGSYGWGGAAGTIALVNSRRRIRFGGYANYMPSEAYDFQQRVAQTFLADLRAMVAA